MIPRGRGRGFPSNRGGRGRGGQIIAQYGNKKLIASNIASSSSSGTSPYQDPEYQEYLKEKARKQGHTPATYANIAAHEESDEGVYEQNSHKELILFLENKDLKWKDDPWSLMQRYLNTASNPAGSYKQRRYYEYLLMSSQSCEFSHFNANVGNSTAIVYNFSKVIIKQIISVEEWGISPFHEKEFYNAEIKANLKYNYWDYMDAFNKVFLYENPRHKHSWFFKVCPEVYKHDIPNWFYNWWLSYGPSVKILPELYKNLYTQWVEISPKLIHNQQNNNLIEGMPSLHFFVEFGIPWIWKWIPQVGYTNQQIPCLQRSFYTKFWKKMLMKDDNDIMEGQETLDNIQKTIKIYQDQIDDQQIQTPSPFQQIARRIKLIKGQDDISRQEIISQYLEEVKKDLLKNLGSEGPTAMSTGSSQNNEDILPGESQDPYEEEYDVSIEDDIDLALSHMQESIQSAKAGNSGEKQKEKVK